MKLFCKCKTLFSQPKAAWADTGTMCNGAIEYCNQVNNQVIAIFVNYYMPLKYEILKYSVYVYTHDFLLVRMTRKTALEFCILIN